MKNTSKKTVKLQDGTLVTVGVYIRKLSKQLSKKVDKQNSHMRIMSDLYQEHGSVKSIQKYYDEQLKPQKP